MTDATSNELCEPERDPDALVGQIGAELERLARLEADATNTMEVEPISVLFLDVLHRIAGGWPEQRAANASAWCARLGAVAVPVIGDRPCAHPLRDAVRMREITLRWLRQWEARALEAPAVVAWTLRQDDALKQAFLAVLESGGERPRPASRLIAKLVALNLVARLGGGAKVWVTPLGQEVAAKLETGSDGVGKRVSIPAQKVSTPAQKNEQRDATVESPRGRKAEHFNSRQPIAAWPAQEACR